MNKDVDLIAEAYQKVLEEAMHCKAAKHGCDCDKCEECKDNQTVDEAKKLDPVGKEDKDINNDGKVDSTDKYLAKRRKAIAKSMHKENAEMADAYQTILEFKQINKRFARRYNKVTAAMLKAQPGSEEYGKLKAEREDLVTILKDHGQTPKDLEAFLAKKETENPLPEVQDYNPQTQNQYQDNSYTDTADLASGSEVSVSAAMENPGIEASTMAPNKPATISQEVKAVGEAYLPTAKNKQSLQFKSIAEIEKFLTKQGDGNLDNTWENITDEYGYDNPETCVKEFNKVIRRYKI